MSELNAQNSNSSNVLEDINKSKKITTEITENVRKRKSSMKNITMSKQLKNNYFSILDNDENCDKECLKIFEKHVQGYDKPTTSSHAASNVSKNKETNRDKENTNNNISGKQNVSSHTKVPPLNVFDVEPNELIKFIRDGLKIRELKIRESSNRKISKKGKQNFLHIRLKIIKQNHTY